jgi:hypothetical protein
MFCDIEDDEHYNEMFNIKKKAVIDKLKKTYWFKYGRELNSKIIGVSADPLQGN